MRALCARKCTMSGLPLRRPVVRMKHHDHVNINETKVLASTFASYSSGGCPELASSCAAAALLLLPPVPAAHSASACSSLALPFQESLSLQKKKVTPPLGATVSTIQDGGGCPLLPCLHRNLLMLNSICRYFYKMR